MREDSITLAIFEKYTPEELTTTAQQMAQAQADYETVEVEKKVSDAAFNERMKKLSAAVSELAKKYNKGGETAQIGCDIRYDHPEPGKKSYFRMDRNELVETHDMTWEEKQETLQFPLAEQPAPEPTVSDISTAELEKLNDGLPTSADLDAVAEEQKAADATGEEVTRLCPFPGCTLFVDHDGDHDLIPKPAPAEFPCNCPIVFPDDPALRGQVHRVDCPHAAPPATTTADNEPKKRGRKPRAQDPPPPTDAPPAPGVQP